MSAKTKRIERSQRFKRAWRGENRQKAVSPVVATLILILIAVAAAAALYLWLVAWQGGVTSGIGSPSAQYTLTIGGSTSAYPFAEAAAAQFEQNNSDVVVSVNQGGSGAGMSAVCGGQVDIGQASTYYGTGLATTPSTLETTYGCPSTVSVEVVAYDGVDAIVASTNTHAVQNASWDTLQAIYVDASTSTPGTGGTTTSNINLIGATTMDSAPKADVPQVATQGAGLVWDQLPACAQAELGKACAGINFVNEALAPTTAGALGANEKACTAAGSGPGGLYANDLCDATAEATSCGFSVCAGGAGGDVATTGGYLAPIGINVRSDVSGTTQSFISRLLAVAPTVTGTPNPYNLGFTGCGGDNQFDGCGMAYPTADGHNGNPGVIAAVAGSADAIGYASDGLAQAGGSNVVPIDFQGWGQTVVVNVVGESAALKAIAKGISDHETDASTYASDQAYVGWRPFINVETSPPTGESLRYLQWIMDPANNENIATQTAEISIYASGLAGTVPVTPIP
jgi:flagellin-like protein